MFKFLAFLDCLDRLNIYKKISFPFFENYRVFFLPYHALTSKDFNVAWQIA